MLTSIDQHDTCLYSYSYIEYVHSQDAAQAREQIRLYVEENKRPPRAATHFGFQDGLTCAWIYAVTILVVYVMQRDQAFGIDWLQIGANFNVLDYSD